MTARCGSINPAHRAKTCRICDKIYKRRHHLGQPKFAFRVRADAARCAICGLAAGNSLNVPVYRYSLRTYRGGARRTPASIGLCDPCIVERGEVREQYRRAA